MPEPPEPHGLRKIKSLVLSVLEEMFQEHGPYVAAVEDHILCLRMLASYGNDDEQHFFHELIAMLERVKGENEEQALAGIQEVRSRLSEWVLPWFAKKPGKPGGNLEFIARGIVHELRQPISTLANDENNLAETVALVRYVVSRFSNDPHFVEEAWKELETIVGRIRRNIQRLEGVAGQLRQLVNLEPPKREDDIAALLKKVVDQATKYAEDPGIAITSEVVPTLGPCWVRPALLELALNNLLRNAQEALQGRKDGRIRVMATSEKDQLVITVEDNGPGIKPDVFILVQNLRPGYSNHSGKGLGWGLELVRWVAEQHTWEDQCGSFELHTDPGCGTVARIRLPLHREGQR
jgi:signal transduction histidine kinase